MAIRQPLYPSRPAPRMAGLPLLVAGLLVAGAIGGTAYVYSYWTPTLQTSAQADPSQPVAQHHSYRQPLFDSAFAIHVRNQVLGRPHAVPEQSGT